MEGRLSGKVAVITGAANGIGEATAELFAAQGARVVIGDIDSERGRALAARHSGVIVFQRTDVTDERQIEALIERAVSTFGRLDIMFNNAAASGDRSAIVDLSAEGFRRTIDLVTGSVLAGHTYAARRFVDQGGGGAIVSTASVASFQGAWAPAAYTIAKHAVIGIVRAATAELAPLGIRSNAVAPGSITTPGSARALGIPDHQAAEFIEHMARRTAGLQPVPRAGRPSDVANAVLFLASDEASWISGATLAVDGGATAMALGGGAAIGLPGTTPAVIQAAADFLG